MGWKFPATGAVGWNSGVEIYYNWGRRVEQWVGNLLQLAPQVGKFTKISA